MVVVAIVLGMLVANMFKDVCGCKNLIEGQCARNRNCQWTPGKRSANLYPVVPFPNPRDTGWEYLWAD